MGSEKYLIGFLAGFSERFAPDMLDIAKENVTGVAQETKEENSTKNDSRAEEEPST